MALNHEALKQTMAGARAGSGWKPKENENRIRVLPPHSKFIGHSEQLTNLALAFKVHFFRIEGRPTEVTRCLEELRQRCPACDAWRAFRKSEDPSYQQLAKNVSPADQYLFNILDLNNPSGGIQRWAANYTCWRGIMEVAVNPQWGDIIDLMQGRNFTVNMTPGTRTRSRWNEYSVMPDPEKTSVVDMLASIQDWQTSLDGLEEQISTPKTVEEINCLLDEMGFPPRLSKRLAGTAAPAPSPTPSAPAPAPAPAVQPQAAPAPTQAPPATTSAPPQTAPPATTAAPAPAAPESTGALHYDPGPDYVHPKGEQADRPANAPRCFGDYAPQRHQCRTCPTISDCQMRMLGLPAKA